jgi:alcohol dehydrogenase YqhD (iron-dependent ADH family)
MQDFTFHNPTRIIFGKDTIPRIGAEAKAHGKKPLFVYGQSSIKKSGLYDTVKRALLKEKLKIVEHGGVKSNPLLSHAQAGIELAKKEKIDFILAVGGGSVIDEGKTIAAGAVTKGNVWDFFTGKKKIQAAMPVLTVLTLPATGSEMNGGMVITNEKTMQKYGFVDQHLYPKVSIMDPTVTFTVSPSYTAYSAVDAISHLVEGYFTGTDFEVPVQDRLVEGIVKTIMESTDRALRNPQDYDARASFMWCASLAWNTMCTAGIGDFQVPSHMLEHPLSALYDIAHGAGLSITQPAWMEWAASHGNKKVAQFAERVFGIRGGNVEKKSRKGIEALRRWFDSIGSPTTLSGAKIPDADIPKIAENAFDLAKTWGLNDYTKERIVELYNMCV